EFGYILSRRRHDCGARAHAAREADHADIGMTRQSRARGIAIAKNQVEHTGREIRFSNQFGEKRGVSWRFLTRLYDDRIAGDEGWGQLSGNQKEREIPRQDPAANAER